MKAWEIDNSFLIDVPPTSETATDSDSATEAEPEVLEPRVDQGSQNEQGGSEDEQLSEEEQDSEEEPSTAQQGGSMHRRRTSNPVRSMGAFEKALRMFDFKGSFLETERYTMARAANPCLEIEDVGPVGLPLSERLARTLMAGSTDSPASEFNRLEIPAERIRFQDPNWDVWLKKEAGLICAKLAGKTVRPSCRLRSLVLECAGSELKSSPVPPADAIATLVIVLPSLFTGGQLECSHGVQSRTVDFALDSKISTSVIAAYSVVDIAQCAITSGYRLSLTYDILQPDADAHSIPSFPDMENAALVLRQAMVQWQEEPEPGFVSYFLQSQCPLKQLGLQALTGSDASLAANLMRLAAQLDFQFYIVHLELYQSKYGKYSGWPGRLEPRKITDLEIENELTSIEVTAFDVQGVSVQISGFDFRWDKYLNGDSIDNDRPTTREYDLFNDDAVRVDEKYDRVLFFLWPTPIDSNHPLQIRYSPSYACSALQSSVSDAPSAREDLLVDSIRAGRKGGSKEDEEAGARVLGKCALQWHDLEMLFTASDMNRGAVAGLGPIGIDICLTAYRTFGWNPELKVFYTDAVKKEASNPLRQTFLAQLASESAGPEVEAWCGEQQELVLRSLNRTSISEIDWLLELATNPGARFMSETVYPQLETQKLESGFWVHFVRRLVNHASSADLGGEFTQKCVQQAIDNLPAFPTSQSTDANHRQQPAVTSIMDVLKLCVETKHGDLCAQVFDKMRQAARMGTFLAECPPWRYYFELTRSLDVYLPPLDDSSQTLFQLFFKEAAIRILAGSPKQNQAPFAPCPFTPDNLGTLDTAIRRAGGFSFLDEFNKKIVLDGRDSESLQTLVRHFVAELRPPPSISTDHAVLNTVVRQGIDVFDTKSFHMPQSKATLSPTIDDMVGLVKFCVDVGARSELQYLLVHFATPPPDISISQHVSKVLAPFLPKLRDYLASQKLDFDTTPFKYFAANIVKAFGNAVMSQKPHDLIAVDEIGCSEKKCGDCKILRDFFSCDEQSLSLPRAAKFREHIEKQLVTTKSWGITTRIDKDHGSPYRLEIMKPANMTAAGLRAENSPRGKALLALLGDETAQRRILGTADYETAVAQICGDSASSSGLKRSADGQIDTPAKKAKSSLS
ncbi:hypothetical protein DFH07DRAFT_809714 [Mycena maculata]|uniref:Uncharacterized protein n=1 Tax=Mycena maculata TaxID=230809 RepID=A0AAD7JN32_9AGAR|nr:hypothetical protein DFH07DRAFT_809714 [Mycena maculata]